MNQFRRSIFKSRLPEKLKPWIMYNVPSESQWFLGFDFCKEISQINNMISALAQLFTSNQQNNSTYNNSSGFSYGSQQKMTKKSQPSHWSSAQRKKGR